jgi:hypothetical protein
MVPLMLGNFTDFSYATLGLSINLSFCIIAMPVSLRVNLLLIGKLTLFIFLHI